jgi:23S rRNA (uracil1939-C5)-methyltransferase
MKLQLTAEKLISRGEALAHHEGKTVFIRGALPDEIVLVEITETKRDYLRGEVIDVIQTSSDRVQPPCPHYGICGGCDLQHLNTAQQARIKQEIVKENLQRIGSYDVDDPDNHVTVLPAASAQGWGYRSRVRFHVDLTTGSCGFLARKSRALVDIRHCPILCDSLNLLLDEKRPLLLKAAAMRRSQQPKQRQRAYVEVPAFAGDNGVSLSEHPVSVTIEGKTLWANADVFFQNNRYLVPKMVDFVKTYTTGTTIVDLYAGVGTFAAFIEREDYEVIAVERDPRCLSLARKHLQYTQFFSKSAEHYQRSTPERPVDTVIVDPPRTGLDRQTIDTICSWKPQRIVYVSCDSVTLARDCKVLTQQGYHIQVLQVFDLYPQTSHVETAVMLSREQ